MFEGKNIHYASDNKLLCSFSNKLCRQRRLNGYGFCIRHILEDKSAPFKQCDYVTSRNNSQKCLNAIPSNQERGYCHSHMQVVGIIPKTERKSKIPSKSGENVFMKKDEPTTEGQGQKEHITTNGVSTNLNTKHSISNGKICKRKSKVNITNTNNLIKHHPTDETVQLHHRSPSIEQNNNDENTHSINFARPNGLSNNVNHLQLVNLNNQNSGTTEPGKAKSTKRKAKHQNDIMNHRKTKPVPNSTTTTSGATTTAAKKKKPKSNEEKNDGKMTVHDRWKSFRFTKNDNNNANTKNEVESFQDLRLMKIMEKLPLFMDTTTTTTTTKRCEKNEITTTPTPKKSSSSFSSYHQQQHNNNSNNNYNDKCGTDKDKSSSIASAILLQLPKVDRHLDVDVRLKNRKNFLLHVSSAFKSHLKTIRRVSKLNQKKDEDDEALRRSLLSCSLTHTKQCAQVLSSGTLCSSDSSSKHDQIKSSKCSVPNAGKGVRNTFKSNGPSSGSVTTAAATDATKLLEDGKTSHNQMLGGMRSNNTFMSNNNNLKHHDIHNVIGENGLINLIDPNHTELKLLAELNDEQNLLLHGRLCDSSPWMNGGMMDIDGDDDEDYSLSHGLLANTKGSKDFPHLSASDSRMLMNMTPSASSSSKVLVKTELNKSNQFGGYHETASVDNCIYGVGIIESTTNKRRPEFTTTGLVQSTVDPNLNLIRQNGVSSMSTSPIISTHQSFCSNYPVVSHLENALRSPIGSTNPSYTNSIMSDSINQGVFDPFEPTVTVEAAVAAAECNFNDDVADLEDNFIPIDQEIANQASQLLEDNGFTEDDFTDLFPETRSLADHKFGDLGLDFGTTFDTGDIDCTFLVNSFPNSRSNGNPESIPITPHF